MPDAQPQENTPLVSVLIPARNAAATLGETLDSLLAQSYRDFGIVLVNDASTDDTQQVCASYIRRFPKGRLQVLSGLGNGISAALNTGLASIKSPLVARLDADDLAEPLRLERQIRMMDRNPDWLLCGTEVSVIDVDGQVIDHMECPRTSVETRKRLYEKCCLYHPTIMFRRDQVERVGGYRSHFDGAEDYDLYLRLLEHGKIGALNERLVRYRLHPGQVTANKDRPYRMVADMALLCALARMHGIAEPCFDSISLSDDIALALRAEVQEHGFSQLSPKVARHMAKRIKKANASLEKIKGLLFHTNATAGNIKEAAKVLLV
ncbi:putative glycosyltransferase EpsE [Pseudovibrio axinellae]|uniref:Putative glycosyltransferase EpsE n=1 Tax=Pseudovibrio axinellae TaxID=989403 RepID=A0A165W090_9HYPH|nr:glycosyltransferase [Pseudovibrio axinellae]KZL15752.1 putative glycosyltransferase EpsE [Pseudovibrio axinellae]SEQ63145.1 Glycosyl transferase family 2 [Pseudovibrio axinellae]